MSGPTTNQANGNGQSWPEDKRDLDKVPLTNEERAQMFKLQEKYLDIVSNTNMSRSAFFKAYLDERRDIDKECGYPDRHKVDAKYYRNLYDYQGIPRRLVDFWPDECWAVQPEVFEDEDEENQTPFEEDWAALPQQISPNSLYEDEAQTIVWEYLHRLDKMSRIGRYGVLLIGYDDGQPLYQAVDGASGDSGNIMTIAGFDQDGNPNSKYYNLNPSQTAVIPLSIMGTDRQYQGVQFAPPRAPSPKPKQGTKILFLRVFDESLCEIVRYEADVTNPRFGLPVMYRITFNDPQTQHTGVGLPLATLMVHWSRVLHNVDGITSSEVFGTPACQPSLHRLLDTAKTYSGSAEMYWKGAFPGLSFETHPQLGGEVEVDNESIREQMFQWQNDLQRFLLTTGISVKTLATQFVDPTPLLDTHIQAICIENGVPQRIFMGSERGELSSDQDADTHAARINFRQVMKLTPRTIVPFVDRLIQTGVLRPPAKTYKVKWPELDPMTPTEKATIALQLTQALVAYVSGGVENVMTLIDYFVNVWGMDRSTAEEVIENAQANAANPADTMTLPDPDNPLDAQGNPIPPEPDEPSLEEQQAQTDASVPTHEKQLAAAAIKKGPSK